MGIGIGLCGSSGHRRACNEIVFWLFSSMTVPPGTCSEYMDIVSTYKVTRLYVQSVDKSLGKTVKPQPKWPKVPFVDTCIMALIL